MDEQEQQNIVNEEQNVQKEPTLVTPPPSHKKLIIGIVAGFVLVVVGVAGAYFFLQPKAKSVDVKEKVSLDEVEQKQLNPQEINFTTTKLATISPLVKSVNTVRFSPKGDRVAYFGRTDPRKAVTGILFVGNEQISDNGPSAMAFSSDGESFAFVETDTSGEQNQYHVVANGEKFLNYKLIHDLGFVPDSHKVVYTALKNEKWRMVLDEIERTKYDRIGDIVFSPDGRRIAYQANNNDQAFIVEGLEESEKYRFVDKIYFSPDSKRLAFQAVSYAGAQQIYSFVIDGIEGKWYEWLGSLSFSPDSEHVAFLAEEDNMQFVVVDGIKRKSYNRVLGDTFTPDDNKVVYKAMELGDGKCMGSVPDPKGTIEHEGRDGKYRCTNTENDKWFLIIGEDEQKKYSALGQQLFFTSDGVPAYHAVDNKLNERYIVSGDMEEKILGNGQFFSFSVSSGGKYAYGVKEDGRWYAVVDGVMGVKYDSVNPPMFIGESDKVIYKVKQNDKEAFVIGGNETDFYEKIYLDTLVFNDDFTKVAFGVQKDNELWWIVENTQ